MLGYYGELFLLRTRFTDVTSVAPDGGTDFDVFGPSEVYGDDVSTPEPEEIRFWGYIKFLPLKVRLEYKSAGMDEVEAKLFYRNAELNIDTDDRIKLVVGHNTRIFNVVGPEVITDVRHKTNQLFIKEVIQNAN